MQQPINCQMPNGNTMRSSHEADLDLPTTLLPPEALTTHIFLDLATHSLISIGKICDTGCTTHFNAQNITITKDGSMVITGMWHNNGLWYMDQVEVPITNISQQWQANSAYSHNDSITTDWLAFLHAAIFSPVMSTLLQSDDMTCQLGLASWLAMWHMFYINPLQQSKATWIKHKRISDQQRQLQLMRMTWLHCHHLQSQMENECILFTLPSSLPQYQLDRYTQTNWTLSSSLMMR